MKISWRQWLPFQRWRLIGAVESADEVPERLPRRGAVVVRTLGRQKWIAFDCPCGISHRIILNTDTARCPFWHVEDSSILTIYPSIDYQDADRRCHYFIRNGKTLWAKDSDR